MKYPPVFVDTKPRPSRLNARIVMLLFGIILVVAIGAAGIRLWQENRPMEVDELWKVEPRYSLAGETRTVRGDVIFDPESDFQFNAVYLVDGSTPVENRVPENGFWFGIRIEGVTCDIDHTARVATCEPFDPTRASTFELKGTLNVEAVGKKDILWLSEVDFEHSRQLVNGEWQPIPLGAFIIPFEDLQPGD